MDAPIYDKSKMPSRHTTEGPERAPHRSYYYAMGLSEDCRQVDGKRDDGDCGFDPPIDCGMREAHACRLPRRPPRRICCRWRRKRAMLSV